MMQIRQWRTSYSIEFKKGEYLSIGVPMTKITKVLYTELGYGYLHELKQYHDWSFANNYQSKFIANSSIVFYTRQ